MDFIQYYSWIIVFHIVAMVSWMAMLFYQPRLFVYHTEHKNKAEFVEVVKIQEYKIYKYIGMPSMWATLVSGGFMVFLRPEMFSFSNPWLYSKLFFVGILVAYSFSLEYFRIRLKQGFYPKNGNFFRAYNEIPTVLLILIVGYVITKTFSLLFTILTLLIGALIIYKILKKPKDVNNEL